MTVHYQVDDPIVVITIDRPEVCNAIDRPTAKALADAMRRFDADPGLSVAVLAGADGKFCAGADLKAMNEPGGERVNRVEVDGDGPVGPTRMLLSKPVIAAIDNSPSSVGSNWLVGVTCESRRPTPCSGSTAGGGASR